MKLVILALFIVGISSCFGQDKITFITGETIKAKVLEIYDSKIIYKVYENQNGPSYIKQKAEIASILYENGTKEDFNVPVQPTAPVYQAPSLGNYKPTYYKPSTPTAPSSPSSPSNSVNSSFQNKSSQSTSLRKLYFKLNLLGLAIPTGNQASTDTTKLYEVAGFGTAGYKGSAALVYQISNLIGIGLETGVFINGVNTSLIQNYYDNVIKGLGVSPSLFKYEFNTKNSVSSYVSIGSFLSAPLSQKLSIDFKILTGIIFSNESGVEFKLLQSSNSNVIYSVNKSESQPSTRTCFSLGLDLKYKISDNMDLTAGLQYFNSSHFVNGTIVENFTNTAGLPVTNSFRYSYNLNISPIMLNSGLVFYFN